MKNFVCALIVTLFIQLCTSTTVEHAENKLRDLKGIVTQKIDGALHDYTKMSNEIEEIVQTTKDRGLEDLEKKTDNYQARLKGDRTLTYKCRGSRSQLYEQLKKVHSGDLVRCADHLGKDSVNSLSTQRLAVVEKIWNEVFEEERNLVACGRRTDCLDTTIAAIKDKMFTLAQDIRNEIELGKHDKYQQVQAIRDCATKSVAVAEQAFSKVPSCSY